MEFLNLNQENIDDIDFKKIIDELNIEIKYLKNEIQKLEEQKQSMQESQIQQTQIVQKMITDFNKTIQEQAIIIQELKDKLRILLAKENKK